MDTTYQVVLFGDGLYQPDNNTASKIESNVLLMPELRKNWTPAIGPRLYHPNNPVGTYDNHIKGCSLEEGLAWAQPLKKFPNLPLPTDAPSRLGLVARGRFLRQAMDETIPISDDPFWHAVAEQTYGYAWCIIDNTRLCADCVHGSATCSVLATFGDYYHFTGQLHEILKTTAQRTVEFINHVHQDHEVGGEEQKYMDNWLATVQAIYLDILHPKATELRFPNDELRSIRYRLINSAARALTLQVRLEEGSLIGDDDTIDAVALAMMTMHDVCDYRHDNKAKEFYNILTIVGGHTGMESVDIVRRFCTDVWAWAIDNHADWAIYVSGRMLAWQLYMARYKTPILLDNLSAPAIPERAPVDPYGDHVLNSLNPLKPSPDPHDFDLRSRCEDRDRYDMILDTCLRHFCDCPSCQGYDTASWQERVPRIGEAYRKKYTDCTCLNTISSYMVLACMDPVWWAGDRAAHYTGQTEEWSSMLC